MTPELETEVAKLTKEHAELSEKMGAARTLYDALCVQIEPLNAKKREVEDYMDTLKPRLRELDAKLPGLHKAVAKPPENPPVAPPEEPPT